MLVAGVLVAMLVLAFLLGHWAQRAGARSRSCCGSGPWPPDDLTRER